MSTTINGTRIADMPDLGVFDDTSSIVGEKAGSGRFSAASLGGYFLPIADAAFLPLVGAAMVNPLTLTFTDLNVPGNNSGQIIRWTNTATPGVAAVAIAPLNIICTDYAGAVSSIWGLNVSVTANSTQYGAPGVGGWPQVVGGSFTLTKAGNCWVSGLHVTAREQNNNPSSVNSALLCAELAQQAGGADDGGLTTTPGVRLGIHLGQSTWPGADPAVFAMGYNHDGGAAARTISLFGVTGSSTYQVFDARTASAPADYADPVAGLRMSAGQIIDFNGASTLTRAGWSGPAGSYLQFETTTSPHRLRWVSGGVDLFDINDLGQMTINTSTGPSIILAQEQFISFNATQNRNLLYTQVGTPRLSWVIGGTERFNIPDTKPILTGAWAGSTAGKALSTLLATFGLLTDATTA